MIKNGDFDPSEEVRVKVDIRRSTPVIGTIIDTRFANFWSGSETNSHLVQFKDGSTRWFDGSELTLLPKNEDE